MSESWAANVSSITKHSSLTVSLISMSTALVSLATILGNGLIITAFVVEKRLQSLSNYYIASLALTDLLIGTISMNIYSSYLILGYWPLTDTLCMVWLSFDYSVCLTSQYTVLLITVDRYCSVQIPAQYRVWRSKTKVILFIITTWLLPVIIFFSVIFVSNKSQQMSNPKLCFAHFTLNSIFNTIITVFYYWITLFVMCWLYIGIYRVAKRLQENSDCKRKRLTSLMATAGQTMSKIGVGLTLNNIQTRSCHNVDRKHHIHNKKKTSQYLDLMNPSIGCEIEMQQKSTGTSTTMAGSSTMIMDFKPNRNRYSDTSMDLNQKSSTNRHSQQSDETNSLFSRQIVLLPKSHSETYLTESFRLSPSSFVDIADVNGWDYIRYIDDDGGDNEDCDIDDINKSNITTTTIVTNTNSDHNRSFPHTLTTRYNIPKIKLTKSDLPDQHRFDINKNIKYKSWDNSLSKSAQRAMKFLKTVHNVSKRMDIHNRNKAKKSFRTISLILGAFIFCWTPYHVLILIKGFCDEPVSGSTDIPSCISSTIFSLTYWMCYLNSPINPFCYAMANAQFKNTLIKLLRGEYFKS